MTKWKLCHKVYPKYTKRVLFTPNICTSGNFDFFGIKLDT
jgi:hypothetical protein